MGTVSLPLIDSSTPKQRYIILLTQSFGLRSQSLNLPRTPAPWASRTHAPQNNQLEPPLRFLLCGAVSDPLLLLFSRMANAQSDVASCGSVRFAFIQQLCSVPLSPSR